MAPCQRWRKHSAEMCLCATLSTLRRRSHNELSCGLEPHPYLDLAVRETMVCLNGARGLTSRKEPNRGEA